MPKRLTWLIPCRRYCNGPVCFATELDGADARRDADAGIWGSADIAEAMRNFVDNWDRHRGKLVESVKNVGGMCASVREAFAAADQDLANTMAHAGQG